MQRNNPPIKTPENNSTEDKRTNLDKSDPLYYYPFAKRNSGATASSFSLLVPLLKKRASLPELNKEHEEQNTSGFQKKA